MATSGRTITRRQLWGEPLGRLAVVSACLFMLAAVVAGLTALRSAGLSPYDESTHADYAYQVAHGHIPERGELVADEIRAEMACRGAARVEDPTTPLCDVADVPAERFGTGGVQYNYGHTPLYYAITGWIARAADAMVAGPHFLGAARLVGVLWLFSAMLVLYVALRRFAVCWPIAACSAGLLALTPTLFYPAGTVTNDAAGALAGALAALMLARITVDGRLGWVLPSVLALLAGATKVLNALPFLCVALLMLVLAGKDWRVDRARARKLLAIGVGIVGSVAALYVGWSGFQDSRGDPDWVNPILGISTEELQGLPFDELFAPAFTGVSLLSTGWVPPELSNAWLDVLQRAWGPLGIAAIAITLYALPRFSPRFLVGAAAAVGVLSFPLIVELQVYVAYDLYFKIPNPRYGMSMVPIVIAAMAIVAEERKLVRTTAVFTGAAALVALYTVW